MIFFAELSKKKNLAFFIFYLTKNILLKYKCVFKGLKNALCEI